MSDYNNRQLLAVMKRLSRKHFRCEWENGLEYILWHWMHHTSPLSADDNNGLYMAHSQAKGWFAILDEPSEGEQFMTTDKWIRLFQDEFDGAVN